MSSLFYTDDTFQHNKLAWNKTFLDKISDMLPENLQLFSIQLSSYGKLTCIFLEKIKMYQEKSFNM